MKMVYIANSRFPSEKAQSDQVMAMCLEFHRLGHTVTLMVPDRRGRIAEDPFEYYHVAPKDRFEIVRVPCVDATGPGFFGKLGFIVQTITFIAAAWTRLRRIRPDVVYSRELLICALPGAWGKVWESHAFRHSMIGKIVARWVDVMVTLTAHQERQYRGQWFSPRQIIVAPDGVNPDLLQTSHTQYEARAQLGIHGSASVCLYVGKFTTMGVSKGVEESICAVRALREQGKDVELIAVGATPDELTAFEPLASEGIRLISHQPQSMLATYYRAADVVLMPFPYTEHYAFYMSPLKLFEYMQSGVPIVASDLPSIREVLGSGEALFVEPGSVPALVEGIHCVLEQPQLAARRALAARALVERYTWKQRAQTIMDGISHLASSEGYVQR